MLSPNSKTHSTALHPHSHVARNAVLLALLIGFVALLLPLTYPAVQPVLEPITLPLFQPVTSAAAAQLNDSNPVVRDQAISQLAYIGSTEAMHKLITFYQQDEYFKDSGLATAHALASLNRAEAYQALIQSFKKGQAPERRVAAMAALENAQPAVVTYLVAALKDTDPAVRRSAAELLGWRRASETTDVLLSATHDTDGFVRGAATWSLGEIGTMRAWPRVLQLQILDSDPVVRDAAQLVQERLTNNVAYALKLQPNEVRALTVAPSNGQAYAVTLGELYALRDGRWQQVSRPPDIPTALAAAGPDGQVLFVGTTSLGLYRSQDGGASWQHLEAGLPVSERLSVTALAINPVDPRQLYMALAVSLGTTQLHMAPLGIYRSTDGGQSWAAMEKANVPMEHVTTLLVIDPTAPDHLFGLTEMGAWRTNIR